MSDETLSYLTYLKREFELPPPVAVQMIFKVLETKMMEDSPLMAGRTHGSDERDGESGDELLTEAPVALSLEQIIDITGEFEHLNELVMIQIEKEGGFSTTQNYFKTVEPILDLLEVEIRVKFRPGMSNKEMKLVMQDWIDEEIAELR